VKWDWVTFKRGAFFAGVFVAGVLVGAAVGSRVGTYEFLLADAQYKASILSSELKSIKAGKLEPVLVSKEISLDGELAFHGRYLESRLSWLWPELWSPDDEPIRRAVAYRLANPFEGPDLSKSEGWIPGTDMQGDFILSVVKGQKDQRAYIQAVLQKYKDSPSKSTQVTEPSDKNTRASP
jgi:hypothetical protein